MFLVDDQKPPGKPGIATHLFFYRNQKGHLWLHLGPTVWCGTAGGLARGWPQSLDKRVAFRRVANRVCCVARVSLCPCNASVCHQRSEHLSLQLLQTSRRRQRKQNARETHAQKQNLQNQKPREEQQDDGRKNELVGWALLIRHLFGKA